MKRSPAEVVGFDSDIKKNKIDTPSKVMMSFLTFILPAWLKYFETPS